MVRCEQCGFENRDTDKFCANCGAPLTSGDDQQPETGTGNEPEVSASTPSFMPPPVTPSFTSQPPPERESPREATIEKTDFDFSSSSRDTSSPADSEWRMSSLGPPPERKRRLWLWIIIGLILACVIVCCVAFAFFSFTGTGQDLLSDWGTRVSEEATKQAG